MPTNPYNPPTATLEAVPRTQAMPALWNPVVASILSFFFTPIFGGIISMKNWQAMGEHDKASKSKTWALLTGAFYAVAITAKIALPDIDAVEMVTNVMGICVFIAWYMKNGKDQKVVIAQRYGASFEKRGWTFPVLAALGLYFMIIITGMIGAFIVFALKAPQ